MFDRRKIDCIEKVGGACVSDPFLFLNQIILNKKLHRFVTSDKKKSERPVYPHGRVIVMSAFAGMTDVIEKAMQQTYNIITLSGVLREKLHELIETQIAPKITPARHRKWVSKEIHSILQEEIDKAIGFLSRTYDRNSHYHKKHYNLPGDTHRQRTDEYMGWGKENIATLAWIGESVTIRAYQRMFGHINIQIVTKNRLISPKVDLKNCIYLIGGCDIGNSETTIDRGYTDAMAACVARAHKANRLIIHKDFAIQSVDPNLSEGKVVKKLSYDHLAQLVDLRMKATHPLCVRYLWKTKPTIHIRAMSDVHNMVGTTISDITRVTKKENPIMVNGNPDCYLVNINDPDMVGRSNYDQQISSRIAEHNISYIFKVTDASTISFVFLDSDIRQKDLNIELFSEAIHDDKPKFKNVGFISVVGDNLWGKTIGDIQNILSKKRLSPISITSTPRGKTIHIIVKKHNYNKTIKLIHDTIIKR